LSKVKSSKRRKKKTRNLTLVLVACIAVVCCVAVVIGSNQPPGPDVGGATLAYIMCQDFIEDRLTAPKSAEWPSHTEISITRFSDREDEAYRVTGYLDSQNRMGAMIRIYYVCDIAYLGDDQWRLEKLDVVE